MATDRRCHYDCYVLRPKFFVPATIAVSLFFGGTGAVCRAASLASPSPSPSPSTAAAATSEQEEPLYNAGGEIYTIDRDGTLYYYFQENKDGTAQVKQEIRYGRDLWNTNAQLRLRIPFMTSYPVAGNPYAGLGNVELGYSFNVKTPSLNHALEIRAAFPTAANGVESLDTELKFFYTDKWKQRNGRAITYVNEFDQTVIKPPGSTWTSYYEGKLTLPDYRIMRGVRFSAIYDFRVLFDSGSLYKSAVGATLFGSMKDVALSVVDTWGIGEHGLWKYKFEANATARF